MSDHDERPRCTGKTATGQPCRNRPVPGTTRCRLHSYKIPGRPTKLNLELQGRIIDLILEGNYIETAAQVVGVHQRQLYRWLERADNVTAQAMEHAEGDLDEIDVYEHVDPAEWLYLDFRHALKSAQAWAESELLRSVKANAFMGWQAFMTILERRHPDRWGRRKVLDHRYSGALEAKGRVELVIPDPETAAAAARILADAGALDVVGNTDQED